MPNISKEQARKNGIKGGRPKGTKVTKKRDALTLRQIHDLLDDGESPLDVMIDNLKFWFRQSVRLSAKLEKFLENADASDPDILAQAAKMLQTLLMARDKAQVCAVDAAPYCHPKLASIEHKSSGEIHLHLNNNDSKY